MKWPPDISNLKESNGFQDFEKSFLYFCRSNNFKHEEMQYLFSMLNTFCFLNKPNKDLL